MKLNLDDYSPEPFVVTLKNEIYTCSLVSKEMWDKSVELERKRSEIDADHLGLVCRELNLLLKIPIPVLESIEVQRVFFLNKKLGEYLQECDLKKKDISKKLK